MEIKDFKSLRLALSESISKLIDNRALMDEETLTAIAAAAKEINESVKVEMDLIDRYRNDAGLVGFYEFKF